MFIDKVMVSELRQLLDSAFHAPAREMQLRAFARCVACQRFPQHMHQSGIAGQKDALTLNAAENGVQAAQCLAGTWNASDEQDDLRGGGTSRGKGGSYGVRGLVKVALIRAGFRDLGDTVTGIEHAGGFDDRGDRPVGAGQPALRIQRNAWRADPVQQSRQAISKTSGGST